MTGRLELIINNHIVHKKDVAGWKQYEEIVESFRAIIQTLTTSDTWEIARIVEADFKNQKSKKLTHEIHPHNQQRQN